MRLNAVLVRAGLADSRRKADELIAASRVGVNGKTTTDFSLQVHEGDSVHVDDRAVKIPAEHRDVILLYKPVGYVCSHNPQRGQNSIFALLPKEFLAYRFAGRLDIESEGLMLLSNDGEFIHTMSHPSFGTVKKYLVTYQEEVSEHHIDQLSRPMYIGGQEMKVHSVTKIGKNKIAFELIGGKNRQLRKMSGVVGLTVQTLIRTSLGPYTTDGVKPGQWRRLKS